MNKRGNPQSLVASHPGNRNAVKQGVHSARLIQERAAEIAHELTEAVEFSPAERLAAHEAARCIAILEAIDRDLDQRGLIDAEGNPRSCLSGLLRLGPCRCAWSGRRGSPCGRVGRLATRMRPKQARARETSRRAPSRTKADKHDPRYLLNHRSRTSRQLEHWLEKVSAAIERQPASGQAPLQADFPDYVRALQRIALGHDPTGTARDRLAAVKELLALGTSATTSYMGRPAQPELIERANAIRDENERRQLEKRERELGIG